MQNETGAERRQTVRIPVDAVLLYRIPGMNDLEMCHVLNVSTASLEILLERQVPEGTVTTIVVRSEESPRQYYRVVGEVLRSQPRGDGWMHVITAPKDRPWSSMFLFDVMCSTFDPVQGNPVEAYQTAFRKGEYEDIKECRSNLDAWQAAILSGDNKSDTASSMKELHD